MALKLLEMIRRGEIVEQGKLPTERKLAEILGESRQMVREAIIILEAWGALDVRERQGMFVRAFDAAEITEGLGGLVTWPEDVFPQVIEMRRLVEVSAARFAAERRTEEDVQRMEQCLDELRKLADLPPDVAIKDGVHWNSLLHTTIADAARNVLMKRVHEGLSAVMDKAIGPLRSRRYSVGALAWSQAVMEQHERIVRAIRKGFPDEAAVAMEEHLAGTARDIMQSKDLPSLIEEMRPGAGHGRSLRSL